MDGVREGEPYACSSQNTSPHSRIPKQNCWRNILMLMLSNYQFKAEWIMWLNNEAYFSGNDIAMHASYHRFLEQMQLMEW